MFVSSFHAATNTEDSPVTFHLYPLQDIQGHKGLIISSPYAKVRNAHSYGIAQRFEGLGRIHRDAVFYRLSLETSLV